MKIPRHEALALLGTLALGVQGQQLNGTTRGIDYPGLSSGCLTALNTTVAACPALLASVSVDNPRLNTDQLSALCTTACRTGLTSVRSTIAAACKAATDTIELPDGVVYPATLIADRFLYTYDLSCRKDKSSGRYCDDLFFSWLSSGNATTAAANCSDCSLGAMQIQLNSPFGYDDDFAVDFQSATASCSSSGYTFTSPATYAVKTNIPNATEDVSTPTCSKPYVAVSGDSCDAIALAKGVSTYSIIRAGGLVSDCSNLQVGASLCLPSACTLYRVQDGDTCASIAASHTGLTGISLLSWNPNITPICSNLADLVGTLICVTPPGGNASDVTITVAPPTTTAPATAVPRPTNAHPNSTAPCAGWYYVQDGDYCQSISIRQNIALRDFYFLNPGIDANCTNLWLDTSYCVEAVGDINTYSRYPYSTSAIYSLTSSAYVTTTANVTSIAPSVTPIVALPLAPGTNSGCDAYVEYKAPDPFRDQSESEDVRLVTEHMNSCDFASSAYPVSLVDFLSWNPSLASISPCYLQAGYSYCALNKTSYIVPTADSLCLNVTTGYPGTVSTCSCFTTVMGYDSNYTTCADVAADANIKTSDLTTWNPWVGSNCDTGLFAGLTGTQERPVCIGVGGATSTPTSTRPTSTSTSSRTSTTSSGPPAATQTGIAANCSKYYVAVSGDGCWAIANANGITLDQFYAWNPAVGSSCQNLWPDYAYCVAIK